MIRTALTLAFAVFLLATPATAQVKPTAVLLNGLAMYQPDRMTPLAPLADDLRKQGWRVVMDTHFMMHADDEEPVVIIGHSMGGGKALEFAAQQKARVLFEPTVITLDATPARRCPVKTCINLKTPLYPPVAGARNIDAGRISNPILPHVTVALSETARGIILRETARLLTNRR